MQNLQLGASLQGRLRNTDLPVSKCLYPLFEAVVNSIYAIDDRVDSDNAFALSEGRIRVSLDRAADSDLFGGKAEIISITIEDNGIGFNNENYDSFCELDSMYRASKGCKGIGRLLWLKCFSSVEVDSCYLDNEGEKVSRHFSFTSSGIMALPNVDVENRDVGTKVILKGISNTYKAAISKLGQETIAKSLFEHCLWFFLREGSSPDIRIIDGTDPVTNLNEIYDSYLYSDQSNSTSFTVGNATFNVLHVRLQRSESNNFISYCAGNRIVKDEKIKNIAGLYDSALEASDGSFYYKCFVTSPYLDEHVSPERFTFLIPEQREDENQTETIEQVYFADVRDNVLNQVKDFLNPYLEDNKSAGREKLAQFVDEKAPYYKPLLASLGEDEKVINPKANDKSIDSYLHTKLVEKEHELIEEGHDVLKVRTGETDEEFNLRVEKYFNNAQQLKQTDLARYVLHRKYILRLLEEALQPDENGNYSKEEKVHEIIMPMRVTSDDSEFYDNNLWIIDEQLVFHHYLASDKTFKSMEVTDCESGRRPDVLIENIYDNPLFVTEKTNPPYATLRIIEFKRPMRDNIEAEDSTKNPIDQCIDYVIKIRNGKSVTKNGRPITLSNDIPAYCYIICDLTPSMQAVCDKHDLRKTYDGLGYFGYKTQLRIYFEVISFDQLLNSANERNAAFFNKLGLSHF